MRRCLVLALMALAGRTESLAAIRASAPTEPTAEIRLERIPNRRTAFFAHCRQRPWQSWKQPDDPPGSLPVAPLLDRLQRATGPQWRPFIELAASPAVEEILFARWPDQATMAEPRALWMVGARVRPPTAPSLLAREFIQDRGLPEDTPQERRLLGYRVLSHRAEGGWVHGLVSGPHLILASSLGLLQAYLANLPSSTAPLPPPDPGILLAWGTAGAEDSPLLHALRGIGIDRCSVGFGELERGLEIRLSIDSRVSFREHMTRTWDPELLESIPADSDSFLVGGSTEWIRPSGEGIPRELRDSPFSLGISLLKTGALPPEGWTFGGAVRAVTSPLGIPPEVDRFLQGLPGMNPSATEEESVRFDPYRLGWTSEKLSDRILFGNAPQGLREAENSRDSLKPFVDFSAEASLGGILSPRMIALPFLWDSLLHDATTTATSAPLDLSSLAPLEFAVHPREFGFEVRLLSASAASHLLFWTSLVLLLDMDYAGKWDDLAVLLALPKRP